MISRSKSRDRTDHDFLVRSFGTEIRISRSWGVMFPTTTRLRWGWGVPSPDPCLLRRFSKPPTTLSWWARVATRNATQRGPGREPPNPTGDCRHRALRRSFEEQAGEVARLGYGQQHRVISALAERME